MQIELSLWGAESLEDAGPGAVDPFLDDAAAALLSVTSVLRTSVETVEGGDWRPWLYNRTAVPMELIKWKFFNLILGFIISC